MHTAASLSIPVLTSQTRPSALHQIASVPGNGNGNRQNFSPIPITGTTSAMHSAPGWIVTRITGETTATPMQSICSRRPVRLEAKIPILQRWTRVICHRAFTEFGAFPRRYRLQTVTGSPKSRPCVWIARAKRTCAKRGLDRHPGDSHLTSPPKRVLEDPAWQRFRPACA